MVDPVAQLVRAAVDFNCGCLGLSFLSVQVLLHGMHLDREQVSCRVENPKRLDIPELDLPLTKLGASGISLETYHVYYLQKLHLMHTNYTQILEFLVETLRNRASTRSWSLPPSRYSPPSAFETSPECVPVAQLFG